MEHQLLSGAFSKENVDVIQRFRTSEYATSRYVVLHGSRSHTHTCNCFFMSEFLRFVRYLPNSGSLRVILVFPGLSSVDPLTVHFQPISHSPQSLLKQWDYGTFFSRAYVYKDIATTTETTYTNILDTVNNIHCSRQSKELKNPGTIWYRNFAFQH